MVTNRVKMVKQRALPKRIRQQQPKVSSSRCRMWWKSA